MLCEGGVKFIMDDIFEESEETKQSIRPERGVPIWEKYTLTIKEAATYFRIGEGKLRTLISEDPDADFILWNGSRAQIKRKKFEKYIDSCQCI